VKDWTYPHQNNISTQRRKKWKVCTIPAWKQLNEIKWLSLQWSELFSFVSGVCFVSVFENNF
jgi:hypothetical protein